MRSAWLLNVLVAVSVIAVIAAIGYRATHWRQVSRAFTGADPYVLVLAVVVFALLRMRWR